jgi:hypothetical protein
MKYYIDSQGFLASLTYVDGTTEIEAPELDMPLSQYRWVNNAWVLSNEVPQRVVELIDKQNRESAIAKIQKKRLSLLAESDWTDTASAPERLGNLYNEWRTYRQALRDITKQSGYPLDVVWPTKPE